MTMDKVERYAMSRFGDEWHDETSHYWFGLSDEQREVERSLAAQALGFESVFGGLTIKDAEDMSPKAHAWADAHYTLEAEVWAAFGYRR